MSTENKYFPLNEQQFIELKEKMSGIEMHLPDSLLGYVWNNYKSITGSIENQPCGCAAAAGHWIKAVNALKDYIKRMDSI
jgi:hypothetical protein